MLWKPISEPPCRSSTTKALCRQFQESRGSSSGNVSAELCRNAPNYCNPQTGVTEVGRAKAQGLKFHQTHFEARAGDDEEADVGLLCLGHCSTLGMTGEKYEGFDAAVSFGSETALR